MNDVLKHITSLIDAGINLGTFNAIELGHALAYINHAELVTIAILKEMPVTMSQRIADQFKDKWNETS